MLLQRELSLFMGLVSIAGAGLAAAPTPSAHPGTATSGGFDTPIGDCTGAIVAWEQLPNDGIGLSAQDDTCYPFTGESADDFMGDGNELTGLEWWGYYWNGAPETPESFRVRIYADDEGLPGDALYDVTIAAFTETVNDPFHYCALLPTAFISADAVTYHLSVQSVICLPPQWGWATGTGNEAQSSFRGVIFGAPEWVPGGEVFEKAHNLSFRLLQDGTEPVAEVTWGGIKFLYGR